MKKRIVSALLVVTLCTSLMACGKKAEESNIEDVDSTPEISVEVSDAVDGEFWSQEKDGKVRSFLTGDWVDKEAGRRRPVASMIENTKQCLPQYGISKAGIIYECVVEGSITRMMAIFDDYSGLEQIGNVRSSRPYYVYFASEYDAIYIHAGGNPAAFELIDNGLVDNLDANALDGKQKGKNVGYRTGSGEHTLYTYSDGIDKGIEKAGYDMSLPADFQPHFRFAEEGNDLADGQDCKVLQLYYFYNHPYWIYNEDDGLYYRYEFGSKQIDAMNNEQLTAKNIIIETVDWWIYEGSEYLGYYLPNNTGTGKFITNGKVVDITWSKDKDDDITHYYYSNGEEIQLNVGTTWIQACQDDYVEENGYYATEEEFKKK